MQEELEKITSFTQLDRMMRDSNVKSEADNLFKLFSKLWGNAVSYLKPEEDVVDKLTTLSSEFTDRLSKLEKSGHLVAEMIDEETPEELEENSDMISHSEDEKLKPVWLSSFNKSVDLNEYDKPSGFYVFKEKTSDNYRWVGWATNKFKDLDDEFLVNDAHKEFYQYLNTNPQDAPELWIWHNKKTARKNRADWWSYLNGFFVYSGILTPEEAKSYQGDTYSEPVGMSHGFEVLERDPANYNRITKYRTFEVSELPLKYAANPYTNFSVVLEKSKENKMGEKLSPQEFEYIAHRLGSDVAKRIEEDTVVGEKLLIDSGIESKSKKDSEVNMEEQDNAVVDNVLDNKDSGVVAEIKVEKSDATVDPPDTNVQEVESIAENEKEVGLKNADYIIKSLIQALNIPALQEVISGLQEKAKEVDMLKEEIISLKSTVEELSRDDDTKIAQILTPAINWGDNVFSASTSSDTLVNSTSDIVEESEKSTKGQNSSNLAEGDEWLVGFSK